MRYGLTIVVAVAFFGVWPLLAQEPPANDSASREAAAPNTLPMPKASTAADSSGKDGQAGTTTQVVDPPPVHGWVRAEYLFWWMRNAPLPVPIVTTGNPQVGFDPNNVNTVNTAGAIGQSGTRILFGEESVRFAPFSGARIGLGVWFDDDARFGVASSGFFIERLTQNFSLTSDGTLPLYFPIFSTIAGAERAIPIADPLRQFSGDVGVQSSLRLWGVEGNTVLTPVRNFAVEWNLLSGFRYADLLEHLNINNTTTDLAFNNVMALAEVFGTHNQFYGGQVGSRLGIQMQRFSIETIGEVAIGVTHEVVDVVGTISQLGPNPLIPPGLGGFPGGIFSQPSNLGRRTADPFAVLSSLEIKFGYNLTPRARVFAGYDLLYWSDVVRPGNQVSHAVNLTQNAVLSPTGAGILVGPAVPAPFFNRSSFWTQGITFGLDVRF
jgi:hypothetical protein